MTDLPAAKLLARPWLPAELLIVAAVVFEESHVTEEVRSCVLASVNVPVAVNWVVFPAGVEGFAGVTVIEARPTSKVVDPAIEPDVAVTMVVPGPAPLAKPWLPAELLMVAVAALDELHVTNVVRFCVLPSVNVPVAVNCCFVPTGTEGLAGVTVIETSAGGATVRTAEPVTEPEVALIVAVPFEALLAKPWLLMVATAMREELHVAVVVRSSVLPSVSVPVAVNCCFVPSAIEGLAGVTAILKRVGGVTVKVLDPLTEADTAAIVVTPWEALLAKPWLVIVATAVLEELHVAVFVRFCVLASVNVPVAMNCCVAPSGIEGFAGVTAIETSAGGVTVRVVDPLTEADSAAIVVTPWEALVAKPWLVIVATAVLEELHAALAVRFCVLPSVNVPVAVNCCFRPSGIEGVAGVTAIETSAGAVTASAVEPVTPPDTAVIVVAPWPVLLAKPWLPPELLIVAAAVFDELQVAEAVRFCVLPSLSVPVAVNCCFVPSGTEGLPGVTAIERSTGGVTARLADPLSEPDSAVIVVAPWPRVLARPWLPAELLMVATVEFEDRQFADDVRFCVVPFV
jgi:hypothetical protein